MRLSGGKQGPASRSLADFPESLAGFSGSLAGFPEGGSGGARAARFEREGIFGIFGIVVSIAGIAGMSVEGMPQRDLEATCCRPTTGVCDSPPSGCSALGCETSLASLVPAAFRRTS
eukprot:CAMPEP_0180390474 /NCGR_PEP_ID=MMETSP0989-20121125/32016_1 /TAXON_ID=697907 /ORGANISM="non described non described, Strain CCMP2293" /LENGTH=116 /DNA_ID=CAMNT_0022391855 /DNA_START=140 /DNA_END=487 /DNA_ORIENTATION=-